VLVVDMNSEGGQLVAQECQKAGGTAVFQYADVSKEDDIKAAVGCAIGEFGHLDVMFNNAGISGAVGPIDEVSVEDWDRTMTVLLRSVFLGMKHSIPAIRKTGGGSIISTSSIGGIRGAAELHPYCAAKAAVINLTQSVAILVARDRIRVNCICPGALNTPLSSKTMVGGEAAALEILATAQPFPRAGKPEDIASMALFLASDEAEWITGAAMIVDGGLNTGGSSGGRSGMKSGFLGPSFEL
jgi:NAD(P)-dependent dehydrogenase (short-subunit alcohol dehydrogenase family)